MDNHPTPEDIIEVELIGDVDPISMGTLMSSVLVRATTMSERGVHAKVLCETSRLTSFTAPMRQMIALGLKDLEVAKVAFYGAPAKYPELREEIAELAGLSGKMKHFATREEAVAWLEEK